MKTEMAADYLRVANERKEALRSEHVMDKLQAQEHRTAEFDMFRRNESRFVKNLTDRIRKQEEIYTSVTGSGQKNHTI